jgi:hypothetical protein
VYEALSYLFSIGQCFAVGLLFLQIVYMRQAIDKVFQVFDMPLLERERERERERE